MPRMLSDDKNILRIRDNISGSDIELHYRTPTTQDHVEYLNDCVKRKGKKVKTEIPQARVKHGLKMLVGFRSGDYAVPGSGGKPQLIASDEKDPLFYPEWKKALEKYASDHLQILAGHVFDAPAKITEEEESAEEDEQD